MRDLEDDAGETQKQQQVSERRIGKQSRAGVPTRSSACFRRRRPRVRSVTVLRLRSRNLPAVEPFQEIGRIGGDRGQRPLRRAAASARRASRCRLSTHADGPVDIAMPILRQAAPRPCLGIAWRDALLGRSDLDRIKMAIADPRRQHAAPIGIGWAGADIRPRRASPRHGPTARRTRPPTWPARRRARTLGTTIGTSEVRMSLTICRVDSMSPPGVSSRMMRQGSPRLGSLAEWRGPRIAA